MQQQELIKLLAQHFHEQFYQLAAANNVDTNKLQQQQQQHIDSNENKTRLQYSDGQDLSASRLATSTSTHASASSLASNSIQNTVANSQAYNKGQQHVQQHLLKIAHSISSPDLNHSLAGLINASKQAPQASIANLHDIGTFAGINSFGFNQQLMLCLQQQQQQPLHNPALGFAQPNILGSLMASHVNGGKQSAEQMMFAGSKEAAKSSSAISELEKASDERLKFSINTILGNELNAPNRPLQQRKGNTTSQSDEDDNTDVDEAAETKAQQQTDLKKQADDRLTRTSAPGDAPKAVNEAHRASSFASNLSALGGGLMSDRHMAMSLALGPLAHADDRHLASQSLQQQQQQQQAVASHYRRAESFLCAQQGAYGVHNPSVTMATAFPPWTVSARGKPRRGMMRRAVFSDCQRVGLEKRFQLQKYISKPDRKKLAEKLGLRDSQVKIWFQNRRMKWRNSKERELLSAGGSREQTLPTRNNPNPDLSDVGETVKRISSSSSSSAMDMNALSTTAQALPNESNTNSCDDYDDDADEDSEDDMKLDVMAEPAASSN